MYDDNYNNIIVNNITIKSDKFFCRGFKNIDNSDFEKLRERLIRLILIAVSRIDELKNTQHDGGFSFNYDGKTDALVIFHTEELGAVSYESKKPFAYEENYTESTIDSIFYMDLLDVFVELNSLTQKIQNYIDFLTKVNERK